MGYVMLKFDLFINVECPIAFFLNCTLSIIICLHPVIVSSIPNKNNLYILICFQVTISINNNHYHHLFAQLYGFKYS